MKRTCDKELFIIRGCSGSGKSTLAKQLYCTGSVHFEADDFFYHEEVYQWNRTMLASAHKWCQERTELEMASGTPRIIVSNTFTTEKELKPYIKMAEENNYEVVSIVVENRHGNSNIHSVPKEVVDAQERRLRNSLKLTP